MSVTALCSIEVGVLQERKLPSGGVAHSVRKTTIRAGSEFDPGEYGIEADELASLKAAGRIGLSKRGQVEAAAAEAAAAEAAAAEAAAAEAAAAEAAAAEAAAAEAAEKEANRPKPEGNDGKKAKS